MTARAMIFTFVFGGYDRLYPPCFNEAGIDYVVFSDDANLPALGWRVHHLDVSRFHSNKAASVYCMALAHRLEPDYDLSMLIGGNIRPIKPTRPMFDSFAAMNKPLGVHAHTMRNRIQDEAEACIHTGKVSDPNLLRRQVEHYLAEGFPDDRGLIETGVLLRNHRHADMDRAMTTWWEEFERWPTRDQISLPFALWKTGAETGTFPGSFKDPGSGFHLSPHASRSDVAALYAHTHAMSATSLTHRLLLWAWHWSWSVKRWFRGLRRPKGST